MEKVAEPMMMATEEVVTKVQMLAGVEAVEGRGGGNGDEDDSTSGEEMGQKR